MALIRLTAPAGAVPAVLHPDSFVSEHRGFVYLCIPKTLSRSMIAYLSDVDPQGYRLCERGVGKEVLRPGSGKKVPTRFTFVRNPYSRIVAFYYNKFVNYLGTPGQRELFGRYEALRPDMAFSEFVDWLGTDDASDRHADPHFLPQYYFLYDIDGRPAVDLLGRVEQLDQDLGELQDALGLERWSLPRLNANASAQRVPFDTSRRWRDVLDDHTIRIITKRYDGDFELLGYERLPYVVRPSFSRGDTTAAEGGSSHRRGHVKTFARQCLKRWLAACGLEIRRARRGSRMPR